MRVRLWDIKKECWIDIVNIKRVIIVDYGNKEHHINKKGLNLDGVFYNSTDYNLGVIFDNDIIQEV